MPYVLEAITPSDQEKIILDAATDMIKKRKLIHAKENGEFTRTWATDRDRGFYLLKVPSLFPDEMTDVPYYVFIHERMYRVNRIGTTHRVYFDEEISDPSTRLLEIQDEVRAAAAVYGIWGFGPMQEIGKQEYPLQLEFDNNKAR
jgi:hypothetical protein